MTKRGHLRKDKLGRGCSLLQAGFQSLLEKVLLQLLDGGEVLWIAQARAGLATGKAGSILWGSREVNGAISLGCR